ncbi:pdu/cob regulatory protein PocR [Salmonella enterica subsp. arizonae]|uniref:Pdu/cob regulatory protein PocR n=1 Tax=Salmonella enterica subsp. arizonae TaxID=59203 RepID=A0A379TAA3_SALER|nr:pdu/cob regulatory protein PocR [Salmonella enterica subsp. arizonae]
MNFGMCQRWTIHELSPPPICLKLIVENCLKKQLNFVVIKDNPQQSEANKTARGPRSA